MPPCNSACCATKASPRPEPECDAVDPRAKRSKTAVRSASGTPEPELKNIFDPTGENVPVKDDTNAGYIHAPSINQALSAAVLRNAYISNASKDQAEIFKVNISSERVRKALSILSADGTVRNVGESHYIPTDK